MDKQKNLPEEEIISLIRKQKKCHLPSGPVYKALQLSTLLLSNDELKTVYHLKESHAPGLRVKTIWRHEKQVSKNPDSNVTGISQNPINFNCNTFIGEDNYQKGIDEMLRELQEMPEEWTVVQLTPAFNYKENGHFADQPQYTNDIYITVFQCGKDQPKPFYIKLPAPISPSSDKKMEIKSEMLSIIAHNNLFLKGKHNTLLSFYQEMDNVSSRLKLLVKDIQNYWLAEWRCLLMGKFYHNGERVIDEIIKNAVNVMKCEMSIPERKMSIVRCLIKASPHLRSTEINKVLVYCFPGVEKNRLIDLSKIIKGAASELTNFERYPIILLVDEQLDIFPWEMIDVLLNQPVTRLPSLHFLYGLYSIHKENIVGGFKVGINPQKGSYLINPDLDLSKMEVRMKNFFDHFGRSWSGVIGRKPTPEEFERLLTDYDVFSYHGHGNASHIYSIDKISNMAVKGVVFLFGCSSSAYVYIAPQLDMYAAHQMYLMAGCPSVVGMLFKVVDKDTDSISSELLSLCLPFDGAMNWREINKEVWLNLGHISVVAKKRRNAEYEPNLTRAVAKSRKSAVHYVTQAALVIRGIPVMFDKKQ